jgi:hypothetical protein
VAALGSASLKCLAKEGLLVEDIHRMVMDHEDEEH